MLISVSFYKKKPGILGGFLLSKVYTPPYQLCSFKKYTQQKRFTQAATTL